MHLSLLSNITLSDLLDDSGRGRRVGSDGHASQHLAGILRGLLFASALLAPFALTFAPAAIGHPHLPPAGYEVRP